MSAIQYRFALILVKATLIALCVLLAPSTAATPDAAEKTAAVIHSPNELHKVA